MPASEEYPAVATASPAITSALAFEDGEKIARRTMLEIPPSSNHVCNQPYLKGLQFPQVTDRPAR